MENLPSASRRRLMQLLGAAAATTMLPMRSLGQGLCSGKRAGTPACNPKPLPAPFEPTGWKTVLLDHFTMQVAELEPEAAYYQALMGWKVRSNDGATIVMDIGDWGGVILHAGLPAAATTSGRAARVAWNGFAWGIAPWNTHQVEAALKSRGLLPVADHNPAADYFAFKLKDPDGFDLWVTNGNRHNRRTTPAAAKLTLSPPFAPTDWKTLYLDHVSFNCSSYKETAAFYQALLGWSPGMDEGSLVETTVSPEIGGLLIRSGRGGNALDPDFKMPHPRSARIDHIAFGIANFDPDQVRDALLRRRLPARPDTGAVASSPPAEHDIHTAAYKSYHTITPNGFNLQISNHISPRTITLG